MGLIALPARRASSRLTRPVRRLNPALGYPIFYGVPGHWYGGLPGPEQRVIEYSGVIKTSAYGQQGALFNTGTDSVTEAVAPVITMPAGINELATPGAITLIVSATMTITPAARSNRGLFARWRGKAGGSAVDHRAWALHLDLQTHASNIYPRFVVSPDGTSPSSLATPTGAHIAAGTGMHLAATFEPSKRIALWLNGSLYGETTSGVPAALFSTSGTVNTWIGAQFEVDGTPSATRGQYCFPGVITWVSLHAGSISDALAVAVTGDNMRRVLLPQPRVWFPVTAAGGTPTLADPGWLVSGNQITPRGNYAF